MLHVRVFGQLFHIDSYWAIPLVGVVIFFIYTTFVGVTFIANYFGISRWIGGIILFLCLFSFTIDQTEYGLKVVAPQLVSLIGFICLCFGIFSYLN